MTVSPLSANEFIKNSLRLRTLAIPFVGIALALFASAFLFFQLFDATTDFVVSMVVPFSAFAFISVGVAIVLYWIGWFYSPSIRWTFFLITFIVATLTLANGWLAAETMFIDPVVLSDTAILLIFSTIIATAFGIMGFSNTASGLRQLTRSAHHVARGELSTKVEVYGRDEVALLANAFNDMVFQLREAKKQREEVEQLRRDLIAWVSHDLRTPLTSIRAMVEALNDGVVEEPEMITRYYRTILSDVLGLNQLIGDLFELAQLDAGGLQFETYSMSLSDLISDTLESFRALAMKRGIELRGQVSDDLDPVQMNSEKIGRILSNLISNALKYTPQNGHVDVSAWRENGAVHVTVQDSGSGFQTEDLPRVFEQFYRGEGARSRLHGSSAGLGLSIARGLVEAHGGRIWAENALEGGAKVTFVLPH